MSPIEWGTIPDAALKYKVSEKTIRRWITSGTLEARRLGPRLIRVNLATDIGRPLQYLGGDA